MSPMSFESRTVLPFVPSKRGHQKDLGAPDADPLMFSQSLDWIPIGCFK